MTREPDSRTQSRSSPSIESSRLPLTEFQFIAQFKIRQGQRCRKLLLSSWISLTSGTFRNFSTVLYSIIRHAPCEMFALGALSARPTSRYVRRRIGNKSWAFLEKLPINPRVSSVRWALRRAHPSILKFPNSQRKRVTFRTDAPSSLRRVTSLPTRDTSDAFALESISQWYHPLVGHFIFNESLRTIVNETNKSTVSRISNKAVGSLRYIEFSKKLFASSNLYARTREIL